MSPYEIKLSLDLIFSKNPPPEAALLCDTLLKFVDLGLLAHDQYAANGLGFMPTVGLRVYCEALIKVPLPKPSWSMPRGWRKELAEGPDDGYGR